MGANATTPAHAQDHPAPQTSTPTRRPAPHVPLAFSALGHGYHQADVGALQFRVEPMGQTASGGTIYAAVVRRRHSRTIAKQLHLHSSGAAKQWCQHWFALHPAQPEVRR